MLVVLELKEGWLRNCRLSPEIYCLAAVVGIVMEKLSHGAAFWGNLLEISKSISQMTSLGDKNVA